MLASRLLLIASAATLLVAHRSAAGLPGGASESAAASAAAPVVVDIEGYGKVEGVRGIDGVDRFLGIRYARAPVGSMRFQPAVPIGSWGRRGRSTRR